MGIHCFENIDFSDIYRNKEDIASNLNEIDYLKNSNSKSYLKMIKSTDRK